MTSAPSGAPSSLNWTPATATSSAASAVTETMPETDAPSSGAVIATLGAVVSHAAVDAVSVAAPDRFPAASVASTPTTYCVAHTRLPIVPLVVAELARSALFA